MLRALLRQLAGAGRRPAADLAAPDPAAPAGRAGPSGPEAARELAATGNRAAALAAWRAHVEREHAGYVDRCEAAAYALSVGEAALAARWYTMAMPQAPQPARVAINLGLAHKAAGSLVPALDALGLATREAPELAEGWYNLGLLHHETGEHAQAEACYRRALARQPRMSAAQDSLICLLEQVWPPRPADLREALRVFAAGLAAPTGPAGPVADADPGRVLRIGYVSADLRGHSSAYFIAPVIEAHDRRVVHVTCYYNWYRSDAVTDRLRAGADAWRDVHAMDDAALARQVREDRIDVLVDLSGHTVGHRLGAFALQPAPVQATYMGYLGSSGLPAVEWRITDEWMDPPGAPAWTETERMWRLPRPFVCFRPQPDAPQPGPPPSVAGGHVVFGAFNAHTKLNDTVLDTWAAVLEAVPRSRLRLVVDWGDAPSVRAALLGRFEAHGVGAERIQVLGRRPLGEYFRLMAECDIGLDPFPYNGGTTTFHSLWMGVPVVTLAANGALARCGSMILAQVGLQELVADSTAGYVAAAAALARDPARLADLRATLRTRFAASPLRDETGLARALESAYRGMWRERLDTARGRGE